MSNIIDISDGRYRCHERTNDGKYNTNDLIRKIRKIVHGVNTTNDSDKDITQFIVECFPIDGIIDTYNKLGIVGWNEMITQMVQHEIWERKNNVDRIRY